MQMSLTIILICIKLRFVSSHSVSLRRVSGRRTEGSSMYVCICRQVTDSQIKESCRGGCGSFSDLKSQLGVASECGRCSKLARSIVKEFGRDSLPAKGAFA